MAENVDLIWPILTDPRGVGCVRLGWCLHFDVEKWNVDILTVGNLDVDKKYGNPFSAPEVKSGSPSSKMFAKCILHVIRGNWLDDN
jgi:hypothetical protein